MLEWLFGDRDGGKKKILIVEDGVVFRRHLAEGLGSDAFKIFEARDGLEGLEIALKKKPDLILLDLMMPRMDGMKVLMKIRAEGDWGAHVPVFILTQLSEGYGSAIHEITKKDPTEYLEKNSIHVEDLLEKIRASLRM
jgi:DNA-binding response OmpR family regulator